MGKKLESHPFGDSLKQHLSRKHSLSQNKLAELIHVDPAIISRLCTGKITGNRELVVSIIEALYEQAVLTDLEEANALLIASGKAPLNEDEVQEVKLLNQLAKPEAPQPTVSETIIIKENSPPPVIEPKIIIKENKPLPLVERLARWVWSQKQAIGWVILKMGVVGLGLVLVYVYLVTPQLTNYYQVVARQYYQQGNNDYESSQFQKAEEAYRLALTYDHELWEAHHRLGILYEDQQSDLEKAKEEYQLAISLGADWYPYNNLARLYNLEENYEQAKKLILKSLDNNPAPEGLYFLYKNLGWAYFGLKDYAYAEANLRRATRLSEDNASAHCLLAQVLQTQGQTPTLIKESWEHCLPYHNPKHPIEERWEFTARQYLKTYYNEDGGN